MTSSIGFDKANLNLDEFKPTQKSPRNSTSKGEDTKAADRAGDKQGFKSREPARVVGRVVRTRKSKEPSDSIYVRGPLGQINRFKEFCNDNNMSYGEAITFLLDARGD